MQMNDEYFKVLVIVVTSILVISLVINGFLAANPHAFSTPPVRLGGYFTESGTPLMGYYLAPGQVPLSAPNPQTCLSCK